MSGEKYDIAIVGSGLGGLLSGAILARKGFRVCVLEKHHQIGGNLQTFTRKGIRFNAAVHYVGSMDRGQILHKVFSYLGVMDRTGLEKLDPGDYERIYLDDRVYSHANGIQPFRERLLGYFPKEAKAIDRYLDMIQKVWNSTKVLNLMDFRNLYETDTQYTQMNAYNYIDALTENEDLKALLGVTSALYAGIPDRSPLITHAIISYHYIQSAYKFSLGSDRIALALEQVILDHGGEVQREQEAVRFQFEGREAVAVELADGSRVAASAFISGIHPTQTLELVEAGRFRKAYVSRIRELENTMGSFCVYLSLKKKSFGNIPSNVFISQTRKVWTAGEYDHMEWPGACMLYTIPDRQDPEYAESMTISTFMKYGDVKRWEDSGVEKRGEAYLAFKQERAARLISLARSRFSELEGAIEDHYAATPLTFRDYTGIPEGSAYGILKDCNHPRRSYISPNTRVPNLFLTGQNSGVGLHGVLGVTVSALFTCAQFLDIGKLLEEIRNEY